MDRGRVLSPSWPSLLPSSSTLIPPCPHFWECTGVLALEGLPCPHQKGQLLGEEKRGQTPGVCLICQGCWLGSCWLALKAVVCWLAWPLALQTDSIAF